MLKKKQYHQLSASISGIYRHSKIDFNRQTMEESVRGTQNDLIMYLSDHPGLSQRQIAKDLCIDPSLLARDLKILTDSGYVTRQQNEADRRVNVINLSETGVKLAKTRIAAINKWWSDLFAQNPGIDPDAFHKELRAVYNKLLAGDR
ncbi:MarR family winged helix-turn-helix transcriptional regulator [Bifidobacterium favimelis]|uniref:MarR family winged helix-turn-helix transcriptional regulator n=1 Tax=Bifidobacterium favimelis TaxID=3122979 RepID=UPI0030EEFD57